MANLELGTPIEPEMVFRVASITKEFTAALVLQLVEEGVLSLEDEREQAYYPAGIRRLVARMMRPGTPIKRWLGDLLTSLPQRAEERRHARTRRNLVQLEEYLEDLLAFSGPME